MDQGQLVVDEMQAGEKFIRQLALHVPLTAAFWVKDTEEGHWYLYITSDQIADRDVHATYRQVLEITDRFPDYGLDPFKVKVVPISNPLARAAIEIQRKYPSAAPVRLGGTSFGGLSVDGVYIYPPSVISPSP